VKTMDSRRDDLIKKYQGRAQAEGVDPLGYYMRPWVMAASGAAAGG